MTVIPVHNPADGSLVGRVEETSAEAVRQTAARLRRAQPEWERLGPAGRRRWLDRYRDWLLDHEAELVEVLVSETGKTPLEARVEIPYGAEVVNYYGRHAAGFLAARRARPHGLASAHKRLWVHRRPYPLVGVILPWNFPLGLALLDALPALLAGAAVVVKPSEVTPLATLAAVAGWREIGAPDVLACVTGPATTGAAVVDAVDMVQFTGSTRTGRAVARRAAERLIPCQLELGGKDAAVVLADCDLARAVSAVVWGALMNSGQTCVSIERVYVEEPMYDAFVAHAVDLVGSLRSSGGGDIGAMATADQLRVVAAHVADAVGKGARILTGGRAATAEGLYFEPTVLVDVDHRMDCMTSETFGPLVPVMKVRDVDEAVALVNDSRYGLSACVFTRDTRRARDLARRIEVGTVNVNDVVSNLAALSVPHGGWKQSGIGARNGGPRGILKYCREQAVVDDRLPFPINPMRMPYTRVRTVVVPRLLRLVSARGLGRRLGLRTRGERR